MRPEIEQPGRGRTRVRNEAVWLYDMNADQWLDQDGYVIIDSSLGLLHDPVPPLKQ